MNVVAIKRKTHNWLDTDTTHTVHDIQVEVCKQFRVSMVDMRSSRRNRELVKARRIAMALAMKLTEGSSAEIGKPFGKKDHTVVLDAGRLYGPLLESTGLPLNASLVVWVEAAKAKLYGPRV